MDAQLDIEDAAAQLVAYLFPNQGLLTGKFRVDWIGTHWIQSNVLIALAHNLKAALERERVDEKL